MAQVGYTFDSRASSPPRLFQWMQMVRVGISILAQWKGLDERSYFRRWFYYVHKDIDTTIRRTTLLILKNASCHVQGDKLPEYRHLYLQFLPRRTTSVLQPVDAGVIACIKRRCQRKLSEWALDLVKSRIYKFLYKLDHKTGIEWIYSIWSHLENSLIRNCWAKTGLVDKEWCYSLCVSCFWHSPISSCPRLDWGPYSPCRGSHKSI